MPRGPASCIGARMGPLNVISRNAIYSYEDAEDVLGPVEGIVCL